MHQKAGSGVEQAERTVRDNFHTTAILAMTIGGSIIALFLDRSKFEMTFPDLVPFRIAIIICAFAAWLWFLWLLRGRYEEGYLTSWWDISTNRDMSWTEITDLTIGTKPLEPLVYSRQIKSKSLWNELIVIAAICLSMLGLFEALHLAFAKNAFRIFETKFATIAGFTANLTAFLALVASGGAIYFTQKQLEAKVKADSRQEWIDKLRGNLAKFIAQVDALQASPHGRGCETSMKDLTSTRIEIELQLNPSEKAHRILMFLTIKLAFFDKGQAEFLKVQDVTTLLNIVDSELPPGHSGRDRIFGRIPQRRDPRYGDIYGDLVGCALRLSHLVLKREWELVKATR